MVSLASRTNLDKITYLTITGRDGNFRDTITEVFRGLPVRYTVIGIVTCMRYSAHGHAEFGLGKPGRGVDEPRAYFVSLSYFP
jgi:hypothetical protein